jgi:hypothetical protein
VAVVTPRGPESVTLKGREAATHKGPEEAIRKGAVMPKEAVAEATEVVTMKMNIMRYYNWLFYVCSLSLLHIWY